MCHYSRISSSTFPFSYRTNSLVPLPRHHNFRPTDLTYCKHNLILISLNLYIPLKSFFLGPLVTYTCLYGSVFLHFVNGHCRFVKCTSLYQFPPTLLEQPIGVTNKTREH